MTEEYITTARAKGLSEGRVLKDHAVPNAMLPMVALIAIDLAFVVGGAFQTEVVFDYPGIGWLTVKATVELNYPILEGAFFLIAVVVILANLVADIMMVYLDPRIKTG
jgi:peptide/nickel transport system permease protein